MVADSSSVPVFENLERYFVPARKLPIRIREAGVTIKNFPGILAKVNARARVVINIAKNPTNICCRENF